MPSQILIADDEANIRRMLAALLRAEGFEVVEAGSGQAAVLAMEQADVEAILLDLLMPPGPDGLEVLATLRQRGFEAPVIMMSGKAQLSDAVRATRLGAFQFLEKPLGPEAVLVALRSALELNRARAENRALRAALGRRDELIGASVAITEVQALVAQVAPTDARVLITGESGTGKELVAAAIHQASRRARGPFVTVNCAAIPRDLVESEMFGHERGAFTGATDRRMGRFELADNGTLFLDEVGDLGAEAQAKLLRTLESGVLQRLGAEQPITVNVRVIAATNRQLDPGIAGGAFRQDLYYRLNIFPIPIPPLRRRLDDLPLLVPHLAARIRPRRPVAFTAEALASLAAYRWPGNVRELANVIERLSILGGDTIGAQEVRQVLPLSSGPQPPAAAGEPLPVALTQVLDDYERSLITAALLRGGGNVAEAARALQTDRANLYRRMRRLRIDSKHVNG